SSSVSPSGPLRLQVRRRRGIAVLASPSQPVSVNVVYGKTQNPHLTSAHVVCYVHAMPRRTMPRLGSGKAD
ncbi:hypothetical protein NEUTE1DRAFT_28767, partial [Neurospora tetrasperma FGSC 2508]